MARAGRRRRRGDGSRAEATAAPSAFGSEFDALSTLSELLPDTAGVYDQRDSTCNDMAAASVGNTMISNLSVQAGRTRIHAAVELALASFASSPWSTGDTIGDEDGMAPLVDYCIAFVGATLVKNYISGSGKCSTGINCIRGTAEEIKRRVHRIIDMYEKEHGVPKERLLVRLPATFECLGAVRMLEDAGVECHVDSIYCCYQALEAVRSGASVVMTNVGRLREWHSRNPGAIVDPHGPRQDAGSLVDGLDPGMQLAYSISSIIETVGGPKKTKMIAAGLRSREDALALAGCDFLLLAPSVMGALKSMPSGASYGDISGSVMGADAGVARTMPKAANEELVRSMPAESTNAEEFDAAMQSMAAKALLRERLARNAVASDEVLLEVSKLFPPPNI